MSDRGRSEPAPRSLAGVERWLRFEHAHRSGVHTYTAHAGDSDMPDPIWPGLFEEYPDDQQQNPYFRHAINNSDGEALAVWRALAWAATGGLRRYAIPAYYRDEAADLLGRDRADTRMVRWEYEVDVEKDHAPSADVGFIPARACVPIPPDRWQREHRGRAGLFQLDTFADLTALDLAVGFDASSEITIFGMLDGDREGSLHTTLNHTDRPELAEVLRPDEMFVDLAVVRDRVLGHTSYLIVKSVEPIDDRIHALTTHYLRAFNNYVTELRSVRTLSDFHAAIEKLLTAPPIPPTY